MENPSGILIYAQLTREKYIHTVFFELVDKARILSEKLGGVPINAIIYTSKIEDYKEAFRNMGLSKVFYYDYNSVEEYSTEIYTKLFVEVVRNSNPEIVLIGGTNQGRDLAPRVSSSLHTGLTADCTDLDINEAGKLAATRPTFGGQLMATILCKNYPQMATIRPGVFRVNSVDCYKDTEFIKCEPNLENIKNHVQLIEFKKSVETVINNLDSADIVVGGGMGLKNEQGFALLKEFADKIGAQIGATRNAVEAGLAPKDVQIGQTGKMIHPKLYIACGISGAIQHTIGIENSKHIIAINNDENAPIFDIADTGVVGDVFEILNEFIKS